MKFMLHQFMRGALERQVISSNQDGKGWVTKRMTFLPDTLYETEDPLVQQFIRGELGDVRERQLLSPFLRDELEQLGISYERVMCSSCPSSKPSVLFNPFKIIEE